MKRSPPRFVHYNDRSVLHLAQTATLTVTFLQRAKLLSAIIFFTWIFPQTIYSVISEIMSTSENSNLYFMDSGAEHSLVAPSDGLNSGGQGVLFCLHRLNYSVISAMTWHYVVLVVPLTSSRLNCLARARVELAGETCHCTAPRLY